MSTFYQSLIGVPDAVVERCRGNFTCTADARDIDIRVAANTGKQTKPDAQKLWAKVVAALNAKHGHAGS
jgi:hypothetical protein